MKKAREYKDSSDSQIADLPDRVKQIIKQYRSFKTMGFRDPSFETTWQNVKLNPQLLDGDLRTYLLQTSDLYDTFWRWSRQKGVYPLYDEINQFLQKQQGTKSIEMTEDDLKKINPRGEKWNYATLQLMKKNL